MIHLKAKGCVYQYLLLCLLPLTISVYLGFPSPSCPISFFFFFLKVQIFKIATFSPFSRVLVDFISFILV